MSRSIQRYFPLLLAVLAGFSRAAAPTVDFQQGGTAALPIQGLALPDQLALVPGSPYLKSGMGLKNMALSVVSDGRYTYLAAGDSGLLVLDLAADDKHRLLAQVKGKGKLTRVVVRDGLAYLADDTGALIIVDVKKPAHPQLLASYPLAQAPDAFDVAQGRAYLVNGRQLAVLDVSRPQTPRQIAAHAIADEAVAVQVADGYAYFAVPEVGLIILDVRDVDRIQEMGRFRSEAWDVAVAQGRAYIANGETGLTVVDVGTVQSPRWLGSVNHLGRIFALRHDEHSVALLNDRSEVILIDVNNPQLPAVVSVYSSSHPLTTIALAQQRVLAGSAAAIEEIEFSAPLPDVVSLGANFGGSRRAAIQDGILYVADWFSGLHLYDISDPRAPRHLAAFHTEGSSKGVLVRGNYAYLADDDHGVQIIDVSNPRVPRKLSQVATPGLAYTMQLAGDYLYLADHRGGFHIISVADIAHPAIVGSAPTAGKAWAVAIRDRIAYVAADTAGLLLFDVGDAQHPRQIGAVEIGGATEDVVLRDHYAFVANFDRGLFVFDIGDPAAPRQIAHLATPGNARGIDLQGQYAYIADWISGIQVVDIADPSRPQAAGAYDTNGWAWGVRVQNQYAYVLDWWGGIAILDVSDPTTPAYAGAYHARGITRDVAVRDNYAYVADGENGLQIFDTKNPLNPIWIAGVDTAGDAQSVWLDHGTAYLAAGSGGLLAVDIANPFEPKPRVHFADKAELVRVHNGFAYAVERGHGVAVIDLASGQKTAWYAAEVEDAWPDDGRLLLATPRGIELVDMSDAHRPALIKRFPQHAQLLRVQEHLLVCYDKKAGIELYAFSGSGTLKLLARYNPGEEIFDLKIAGNLLYASGSRSGLLALDIRDRRMPALKAAYPAATRVSKFDVYAGTAFMAGNDMLTSVRLLPDIALARGADGAIQVELPPQFPFGSYHLLALDPANGRREIRYDALRVARPAAKKPRFSMQDLERSLRERGLAPAVSE